MIMKNSLSLKGYVSDTTYADKFYKELSPVWLNYVAVTNGGHPIDLNQSFTYLELGCGFGHSVITNAAAFPNADFHACDFNPLHIEKAKSIAKKCQINNLIFYEDPFENLLTRNLPDFDFIVLHGVYSWVEHESRQAILNIIDKKLKKGGMVYISYNCFPGCLVELPIRKLLVELSETEQGDAAERSEKALKKLHQMSENSAYFKTNPPARLALDSMLKESGHYLAHEFLNSAWEIFYSVDIADQMQELGLYFLGSATLVDNHPMLELDNNSNNAINALTASRQRQLCSDFAMNKRFRRDVFVRGEHILNKTAIFENMQEIIVGCIDDANQISNKIKVPRGIITFNEDFIQKVRALMQKGSMSIREIMNEVAAGKHDEGEIIRNVIFLVAGGILSPYAQKNKITINDSKSFISPSLERILKLIIDEWQERALPSEILGNGVIIQPIQALALLECAEAVGNSKNLAERLETSIKRKKIEISMAGEVIGFDDSLSQYCQALSTEVMTKLLPKLKLLSG